MNTSNGIVLIGMSGVGKSTIGALLAKKLQYNFVDGDDVIIKKYKKPLRDLLSQQGDEKFLSIQSECMQQISFNKTVLSPGGSVVYAEECMKNLAHKATIIYLIDTKSNIQKRISNLETRGIVGMGSKTFDEVFTEREHLYKKYAHINVVCTNKSLETVIDEIITLLGRCGHKI